MVLVAYSEVYYLLYNVAVSLLDVLTDINIKTGHIGQCYKHVQ
jgi:hypothetical protein